MIYSNRAVYHLVMRLLYGRHFGARYAAIAAEIPSGAEVIDVCAGDGYLYLKFLRQKSVRYLGLDISPRLVDWARKRGVSARQFNLWHDTLPPGDVVVMQASLYQFLPQAEPIIRKLLSAARCKVIISEPIRNVSSSLLPLVSGLSRRLSAPDASGGTYTGQRFDRQSLADFFHSFETFERSFMIPGEREMVGIFRGECSPSASPRMAREDAGQEHL